MLPIVDKAHTIYGLPAISQLSFCFQTYLNVAYPSGQYSKSGHASPEIPLKHLKLSLDWH